MFNQMNQAVSSALHMPIVTPVFVASTTPQGYEGVGSNTGRSHSYEHHLDSRWRTPVLSSFACLAIVFARTPRACPREIQQPIPHGFVFSRSLRSDPRGGSPGRRLVQRGRPWALAKGDRGSASRWLSNHVASPAAGWAGRRRRRALLDGVRHDNAAPQARGPWVCALPTMDQGFEPFPTGSHAAAMQQAPICSLYVSSFFLFLRAACREYEMRLINELTEPGGVRAVPPRDALTRFVQRCASLDRAVVVECLIEKIAVGDGDAGTAIAKAVRSAFLPGRGQVTQYPPRSARCTCPTHR